MNDLAQYADVFKGITPWSGDVPRGFMVDFLGILTDAEFRVPFGINPATVGGNFQKTRLPMMEDGEGWFETVNWVEAARSAKGRYTMVTLGACYAAQAVGSVRALQLLNPMPSKLVAVEPEPDNCRWVVRHLRDNGIDPDEQWLVPVAISDKNDPVLFPVGSPGTGAQNCVSTNEAAARKFYAREIAEAGHEKQALQNILLHNSTGLTKDLVPGSNFMAEIKFMSAVTLKDILSPFDVVDYLESDIQQSEILVFPPFIDFLMHKVRRIHIGTHGRDVHVALHNLFESHGWKIIFSFEPNSSFSTALGAFSTNDGVLTVRNPSL